MSPVPSKPDGCPDEETLIMVLMGNAPISVAEKILTHIETCPACPDRLDEICQANKNSQQKPQFGASSKPADNDFVPNGPEDSHSLLINLLARTDAANVDLSFLSLSPNPAMLGRVGTYDLVKVIGTGGMGIVFEAVSPLQEKVALKILKPGQMNNIYTLDLFLRETHAAQRIRHPGIVPILSSGVDGRLPYFVMPLLQGMNFSRLINREAPLKVQDAIALVRQAAEILQAAHQIGILHRDIKPSNLWVQFWGSSSPRVFLLDFGLALFDLTETPVNYSGEILGTPAYFSPEQAEGQSGKLGTASDLYSLGCVFYELLTGAKVFPGKNALETLRNMLVHKVVPPKKLQPSIPSNLNDLVMRLLARDPAKRPQNAMELIRYLDDPGLLREPVVHRRTLLTGGLLAGVAALGGAFWKWSGQSTIGSLEPGSGLDLPGATRFDLAKTWDKDYQGKCLVWLDAGNRVWRRKMNGTASEQVGPFEFKPVKLCYGLETMALVGEQGEIGFVQFKDSLVQPLGKPFFLNEPMPFPLPRRPGPRAILWDDEQNRFLVAVGNQVKIFDGAKGALLDTVLPETDSIVTSIVQRPPSKLTGRGFVVTQENGTLGLISEDNLLIRQIPVGDPPLDFRVSIRHDGVESAFLDSRGGLYLTQAATFNRFIRREKIVWQTGEAQGSRSSQTPESFKPYSIHYSFFGTMLLLHGMPDGKRKCLVYSTVDERVVAELAVEDPVQVLPDQRDMWVLDGQGRLHLFEDFESRAAKM